MKYNDNQIINNQQSININNSFEKINTQQIEDLQELYDKLLVQKNLMLTNNSDHSLDKLISSTNRHLDSLAKLINTLVVSPNFSSNNYTKHHIQNVNNIAYPHFRPYINQPIAMHPEYFGSMPNTTEPNPNSTPINPEFNLPNTNNNPPNIDENQTQPPFDNDRQNIIKNPTLDEIKNNNDNSTINQPRRRNSPLQSNILSTIAKTIFGGRVKAKNLISEDKYRNRFHNIATQSDSCNPRKKMVTNELDILRLLLLYIALRPHNRHIGILSSIASEQLEILTYLI